MSSKTLDLFQRYHNDKKAVKKSFGQLNIVTNARNKLLYPTPTFSIIHC